MENHRIAFGSGMVVGLVAGFLFGHFAKKLPKFHTKKKKKR
jgi:hypothetical protein